jgi:hypothetical protein
MSKFIRLVSGVLCLGVLALGVAVFDHACQPLSHPWGHADLQSPMAEVVGRRERLKQLEEATLRRKEVRWRVAEEVIAGRLSLAEAIEQFQTLDREGSLSRPWPAAQRSGHFGISEEEWDGRNVLSVVRQVLADRPDKAAAVAGRLEEELQQLLAQRQKRPPEPVDGRTGWSR